MKLITTLLALAVMSLSGWSAPKEFTDYGYSFRGNQLRIDNLVPPSRMTIDELSLMAESSTDINDFMSRLFRASPVLRDNFVMMHTTGSLQRASFDAPRVIVFGDGYFISFNTTQGAKPTVEVIALNDDYEFTFLDLDFSRSNTVEKDPEVCAGCHGNNALPIWEPYDFWPNAYGSHISRFGTTKERDLYNQLVSRSDGVFQYLRFAPIRNNFNGVVESFTQYAYGLGMLAMVKQWSRQAERLDPYFYAMLGALEGCFNFGSVDAASSDLKTFFPRSHHAVIDREFLRYVEQTRTERQAFKNYLIGKYDRNFDGSPTLFPIDHNRLIDEVMPVATLKFLFDKRGLVFESFMMSQGQNPGFLQVPGNFEKTLQSAMFAYDETIMSALNPDITDFFGFSWPFFDCETLKSESLQATADETFVLPPVAGVEATPRSSIGLCIDCHVKSRTTAPFIPFDDSMALREWLLSGGQEKVVDRLQRDGFGKMPPNDEITEDDKKVLIEVFETLTSR
ncbi:MAG: hypothetical protein HRU19_27550 [Pseudobacteriovorax sp.]|nr:hypothetical protein [Pseudobacteriovorax sp.]